MSTNEFQTRTDDGSLSELLEGLSRFVEAVAVPLEAELGDVAREPHRLYGTDGNYRQEVRAMMQKIRTESAAAGYYTMFLPADVGGGGLDAETYFEVWEHLYTVFGPGRPLVYETVAHWATCPGHMIRHLPEDLRGSIGHDLVSGHGTACFAMSEPDAGSDAWSISMRAERDGDEWVLNGTKQWISNGANAKYAFVFAVTDDDARSRRSGGISCFLVPTDVPGFSVDSTISLFGHWGGNEAILSFSDVRIPDRHVIGPLNDGFRAGVAGISLGRLYNTARSVGLARWALDRALDYTQNRAAFGKTLSQYQGVTFPLAESATEIYGARLMGRDCARRIASGADDVSTVLAMAKAFSTETCFRAFDRCMQAHGAMGLTSELRLVDGFHTARALRIADGTSEILRRNIARALYRGDDSPFRT